MTPSKFVSNLAALSPKGPVFNPWKAWLQGVDVGAQAPVVRQNHLRAYFEYRVEEASILTIAEAPGYQGARFSGVAMTCERTLLGGKVGIPSTAVLGPVLPKRTSSPVIARNVAESRGGFCEPTATFVWGELMRRAGAARQVVLWNVFPFHPHFPGDPLTNRTPSDFEVSAYLSVLDDLIKLFPDRPIVAVGETSLRYIKKLNRAASGVRHPANGGARAFRKGLNSILDSLGFARPTGDLFGH